MCGQAVSLQSSSSSGPPISLIDGGVVQTRVYIKVYKESEDNEIAMREGEKGIDTFEPFNPEYPKHMINTTIRRAIVYASEISERDFTLCTQRE